ncbi:hypothetical protein Flavo103_39740 [Flavobacterium collinsii]|jgi:hypothetical protein|uniref:hypothetical protein n=1 Tax=Flavobacterium collinsii TaxID=1114861 RepID=UPI0022CBC1E7|nr:hypothetical protein [Flavobacterium collinsii]GIQ60838.1 hypothetical protein Flavo103_39740 [Flavobacterium collinsii]
MEQNSKITISIPSNHRWVVENLIERFEKAYQIKIFIEDEEDRDGVNFFIVSSDQFTHDLIFEIGYYYSGYIRQLRDIGEIDE